MPISLHHPQCVLLRPARSAKAKQPSVAKLREYGTGLGLAEIPRPDSLKERPRRHFALKVDDLDAMRAKLSSYGARFEEADPIPGWRRCYVFDPFGNKIELDEIP